MQNFKSEGFNAERTEEETLVPFHPPALQTDPESAGKNTQSNQSERETTTVPGFVKPGDPVLEV